MTIKEAIKLRHMVRKYTDKPIPADLAEELKERIAGNNQAHGLQIKLVSGNADGLSAVAKLLLAKNVKNYLVLAGPDTPDLDEKLGYCGSDLMLYAQTLGLNTWWVGGMFSKNGARKNLDAGHNVRVNGVIVVGYGQTQGVPHQSKKPEEVSWYEGEVPQWFRDGVEALLFAPTALNKQGYMVKGSGNKVSITCDDGVFSGIDLGIGKYHFEVGAGRENFEWEADKTGQR